MEERSMFISGLKPNRQKPTFTIKLMGNANDISEIMSDINAEFYSNTQFYDQTYVKTNSFTDFEPSRKKLKMKEEILPHRVILVVPKNSPLNENQQKNRELENDEENNKLSTQTIVEHENENNLLMNNNEDANLNVTYEEDIKNHNTGHEIFNHNHESESINSEQDTHFQYSTEQLIETTIENFEPIIDKHEVPIIRKHCDFENPTIKPLIRKLHVTVDIDHSNTLTQNVKNNCQPISDKNLTRETFVLSDLTPMKRLHSPIVLKKSNLTNHFRQRQFPNRQQKTISTTVPMSDKSTEGNTSPFLGLGNLTETTNCSTDSKFVNTISMNHSPEDKRTYNLLSQTNNFDLSLDSLETNKTTTESSLQGSESMIIQDQERSPKNTKIDIPKHKCYKNTKKSALNSELKFKTPQKNFSSEIINNKCTQPVLDENEKMSTQASNDYECINSLQTSETEKDSVSLDISPILHDACYKKQHIKSPQIEVNSFRIQTSYPNSLNNFSLKKKIQEFKLFNKYPGKVSSLGNKNIRQECTEQYNNSLTLPVVSESLVSTTTVESGQRDKKMKDCQCDQLRREVDQQWKLMSHLRLHVDKTLSENSRKCDSIDEEQSQLDDDKYISLMLIKEIEEKNQKLTENLRKEQIRNNTLKLTLKQKNMRIKQLERRIKTVFEIFKETEKHAAHLKNLAKSPYEITDSIVAQYDNSSL